MDVLVLRVAARYSAEVIPFKPKPGTPTITIGGKKYVLSTYGGDIDEMFGGEEEGGARFIRVPGHNSPWRFLWVFDTDKKYVYAWRVSDGDSKAEGPASSMSHAIVRLEKTKQLNRVTHEEYRTIERMMNRISDEHIRKMEEMLRENATDFQKRVDAGVNTYFERLVRPKLDRAIADVKHGAIPMGWKLQTHPGARPEEAQKILYVVGKVLGVEMALPKVEEFLGKIGIDVDGPESRDNEAAFWAVNELMQKVIDSYR